MQENPSPPDESRPKGKPPYLFLIPVALGLLGFIGYQTVRMGTAPEAAHYKYELDTSTAQPVRGGTIVVHANAQQPQRVAQTQPTDRPSASPTPLPSATPTAAASATPAPKTTPTHAVAKAAVKPAHHSAAHRDGSDDQIATQPVPHIERPIPARAVSNVTIARETSPQQPQSAADTAATTPPITDAPSVRNAPAQTAAPVQVAEAQHPAEAPASVNASDRVVDARMTYAAAPDYPEIARDQGIRGTSVVFVTVDPNGSIVHISIATSSGSSVLDHSAVSAARSSRYVPPKVDGKPATETYRVTYDFAP